MIVTSTSCDFVRQPNWTPERDSDFIEHIPIHWWGSELPFSMPFASHQIPMPVIKWMICEFLAWIWSNGLRSIPRDSTIGWVTGISKELVVIIYQSVLVCSGVIQSIENGRFDSAWVSHSVSLRPVCLFVQMVLIVTVTVAFLSTLPQVTCQDLHDHNDPVFVGLPGNLLLERVYIGQSVSDQRWRSVEVLEDSEDSTAFVSARDIINFVDEVVLNHSLLISFWMILLENSAYLKRSFFWNPFDWI
jgi:hypothetical protein